MFSHAFLLYRSLCSSSPREDKLLPNYLVNISGIRFTILEPFML